MCCRKSCRRCSARYPDLRIELRETQTKMLLEELIARRRSTCVMLALPVDESRRSRRMPLFDDPFLLAVPAGDKRSETARCQRRATSTSSG